MKVRWHGYPVFRERVPKDSAPMEFFVSAALRERRRFGFGR